MGIVRISNKISVSPITEPLIKWTAANMVVPNPQYIQRQRLGKWLGRTPKNISMYEIRGNTIIYPYGVLKEVLEQTKGYDRITDFVDQPTIDYGGKDVPLYDYQKQAVEACYKAKLGILQSAAGSGKTQMGIALVKRFGKRALWLTHTKDLLNQSRDRAKLYMNPALMGEITEGRVTLGQGITFATVQTMCRIDLSSIRDYFDVIICDECHRIAGSPTMVTNFSKVLNALAARHKFGLSATVHRSDGLIQMTYSLLGKICYIVPDEAVQDKILRVTIKPIDTHIPESTDYLGYDGMLSYTKLLSYLCEQEDRNRLIAEMVEADANCYCLVLSDRLEHLNAICSLLPDTIKAESVCISGKTKSKDRVAWLDDMRNGDKKVLFATYSLAKEGLDIPILSRLFLTTPHKDSAVITQSIGRIARVYDGKDTPICYDFVDTHIRYLVKAYKDRCTVYRKNHCQIL